MNQQVFELLSLNEIFDAGKRQFSVPDYQRGYSWEKEQRDDLIGDIEQIKSQNHRHFTGTVVASRIEDSTCYDLVDGQQRITSLVILISSIVRLARTQQWAELVGIDISKIESWYLCNGADTGNTCYQLQLGKVRAPLFHEVLHHGSGINHQIKTKADQNIVDAAVQFDSWLLGKPLEDLGAVFDTVTRKLGFLLYAPKQDAEIGLMFEVINNRGKPLSEVEKIKNYLIYFASRNQIVDLKTKVNASWPVLLESLNLASFTSNDDENRFLRVCWIVFEDYNKSRSYHVYDNLKHRYPAEVAEHWQVLMSFVDFIVNCARTYASLYDAEQSSLSPAEKVALQRIALHPAHASILPLLVSLFAKEQDPVRRAYTLDLLEKLNFRYYVTGIANRNDSGQGDLFWLAHEYYQGTLSSHYDEEWSDSLELLQSRLVRFICDRANDHKFVQYLTLDKDESGDYYHWNGLKYFLGSYEDSLLGGNRQASRLLSFVAPRDKHNPNDFYHLEHIWAAKDYEVVSDADDRDVNKRRLGNFIILLERLNIKVSNARPENKVDQYFEDTKIQPNTLMIRELVKDFEEATEYMDDTYAYQRKVANYWYALYERFLDIREQRMVNFALHRWRVEGISRPVESVKIDSDFDGNEIFKCYPEYADRSNLNEDE
tara:strand:- start:28854 stop:30824 length:1971 start_codon:yes stop_codon:yes gene_type:complete